MKKDLTITAVNDNLTFVLFSIWSFAFTFVASSSRSYFYFYWKVHCVYSEKQVMKCFEKLAKW